MKFIKSNKIIAIAIILILTLNVYVSFEVKKSLSTRRHRMSVRQEKKLMPKINNKWGLLAAGFVVGTLNTDLGFTQCFKATQGMVKTIEIVEPVAKKPETVIQKIIGYLGKFIKILDAIMRISSSAVCTVLSIKGIVGLLKGKIIGRFFIEGRLRRSKEINFSSIKAKLKSVLQKPVEKFMTIFYSVKESLLAIWNHPKVQFVVTIIKCIQGVAGIGLELVAIIKGLIDKVNLIIGASTAAAGTFGATLVPVLANFAYGLFCNYAKFWML